MRGEGEGDAEHDPEKYPPPLRHEDEREPARDDGAYLQDHPGEREARDHGERRWARAAKGERAKRRHRGRRGERGRDRSLELAREQRDDEP